MSTTTLERAAPSIDPRLRARRIEVQRGQGRRRLQRVVDLGLLVAVAVGFGGALRSPLLDVDEVRVAGATHITPETVIKQSGLLPGQQLMDLDLRAIGGSIATLPWVSEVRIDRGLDGTVHVLVTERVAVAVVGEGADTYLVDVEGHVLAASASDAVLAASLVRLADASPGLRPGDALEAGSSSALLVAERLASAAPGAVATVSVTDEVTATLAQGGTVRFGDATQLEAKVRSLRTMLDRVDLTCLATIDLRSPYSAVLTREEGCS